MLYGDIYFYVFFNFDGSHDHVICTTPFEVSNIILSIYENNNNNNKKTLKLCPLNKVTL